MKLCALCKHVDLGRFPGDIPRCKVKIIIEPIFGEPKFECCAIARTIIGECGVDAKLFEPNQKSQNQ